MFSKIKKYPNGTTGRSMIGEALTLIYAAVEGNMRVLGLENKKNLASLNGLGTFLYNLDDNEGALRYFEDLLTGQEKMSFSKAWLRESNSQHCSRQQYRSSS